MKADVVAAVWRFAVFVVVSLMAIFALLAIFAQLRFQEEHVYYARFVNVSGLKVGDFVRVAGVEVGKVKQVSLHPDSTLTVEFSTDPSVVLTDGNRAAIRYDNLIGDRFLELLEGVGGPNILSPGGTIPLDRTEPALDLDALIGGFRPLFRALDPDQVNELTRQLIDVFQDQGPTIDSFLAQTAAVTNTLADRDELIGQVVVNLNTVLGSLGTQSKQFDTAVTSLSDLVHGLEGHKQDISTALAYTNNAAGTLADLLVQARRPLKETVAQSDRTTDIMAADHDYLDNILNTLPDKYKVISRQGLYGDYFAYYFCDIYLKVNGKGGQPVTIKVVGQSTGRCAPR